MRSTALFASDDYDCGDIIAQKSIKICYPIKIKDAIRAITEVYQGLATDIFADIVSGRDLERTKQDDSSATYSLWRDEEDYWIDWQESADRIKRFIDAVGEPYKGAKTAISGESMRVIDAEVVDDVIIANRTPGKIIFVRDGKPVVVCGTGLLRIDRLVKEASNESALPLSGFRLRFT